MSPYLQQWLPNLLSAVERVVEERGPSRGSALRRELVHELRRLAEQEVLSPPAPEELPSTTWVLHHSPRLSVVDVRDGDPVWNVDVASETPAVPLPDPIRAELRADAPAETFPRQRVLSATARRFGSARDVTLDLEPLTLLVGPNGSGKSTLLDAVCRTLRLAELATDTAVGSETELARRRTVGQEGPIEVHLEGSEGLGVGWSWRPEASVRVSLRRRGGPESFVAALRNHDVTSAFGAARLVKLDPSRIGRPAYSEREVPQVDAVGSNVPVVLADLAATQPDRFQEIVQSIREVVPAVEGLRMPRARVPGAHGGGGSNTPAEVTGHALEVQLWGHWLPAEQISEGTRLVIALRTLLAGSSTQPRVLLLDDLERGLHPGAQRVLVEQLQREVQTRDLQVLASTHSPFVLDEVAPSGVRLVSLDEQGHTRVQGLETLPGWEDWRNAMTAGEFWIHAGPDWAAK